MKRLESNAMGGCIPALITPMHPDGKVDFKTLERFYAWHASKQTPAVVLMGSTGEGALLSCEERLTILQAARPLFTRQKLIVGVSSASTQGALQQAMMAQEQGADALLVSMPYYVKPSQEALCHYVQSILDRVDRPIMLYQIPGRTGVSMSYATLETLLAHPQVLGIKDASGSLDEASMLLSTLLNHQGYWSGDDTTSWLTARAGGFGCVSVLGNLLPDLIHRWLLHASEGVGGNKPFQKAHLALQPWFKALSYVGNPSGIKALVGMALGVSPALRLPLLAPDPSALQAMCEALEEEGLSMLEAIGKDCALA